MRAPQTYGLLMTIGMCWAPGLAAAGDIGCVWRALPAGVHQAVVESYDKGGPDHLLDALTDDEIETAINKCISIPANRSRAERTRTAVIRSLAGYTMEVASSAYLKSHWNIEASTLDQAWGKLQPSQRRALGKEGRLSNEASEALLTAMLTAYPDADPNVPLKGGPFDQLTHYFIFRASRELLETQF